MDLESNPAMQEELAQLAALKVMTEHREHDRGDPVKLTARIASVILDVADQERRDCADYVRYACDLPTVADELENREERIEELLDLRCKSVPRDALT